MRQPFFKTARQTWYVTHNGRQVNLGPDREAAFAHWKEMQVPSNEHLVSTVVQKFLARGGLKGSTAKFYAQHLKLFLKKAGGLRVCDLRAFHLTELLAEHGGANYKHNLCRVVKTCFKWLADNEYIATSPFRKVATPPAVARGDEAYIDPQCWVEIARRMDDSQDDSQDIIHFLHETGARPKEARTLEARHVQGDQIVFPKSESKGGRDQRVIHLTEHAEAIIRRLALKRPTGPLFLDNDRPWTAKALSNEGQKLGFKVYWLRHTKATDLILAGVDLVTVATLLGHSGLAMLSRCYQHVQRSQSHLKAALQKATA